MYRFINWNWNVETGVFCPFPCDSSEFIKMREYLIWLIWGIIGHKRDWKRRRSYIHNFMKIEWTAEIRSFGLNENWWRQTDKASPFGTQTGLVNGKTHLARNPLKQSTRNTEQFQLNCRPKTMKPFLKFFSSSDAAWSAAISHSSLARNIWISLKFIWTWMCTSESEYDMNGVLSCIRYLLFRSIKHKISCTAHTIQRFNAT